jgi:sirohydrochlorin cobaltochelatase
MPLSRRLPQDVALLIAAHGERRIGGTNAGVAGLAADLIRRNLADEIGIGFVKGHPGVDETVRAFASSTVLVYPLFLSDGYFSRVRLPQLLAEGCGRRSIRVLPPLGLDPALAALVGVKAEAAARAAGVLATDATLVLFAHGSRRDPASRTATAAMAAALVREGRFGAVRGAFLEEPPSLACSIADVPGPVVVAGLFAGEGLHGGTDLPDLLRSIGRRDVVFAGNVASFDGIAELVAGAVTRAAAEHA